MSATAADRQSVVSSGETCHREAVRRHRPDASPGRYPDAVTVGEDPDREVSPPALLAPLQWMAIGGVIAVGIVSIEGNGWTLQTIGLLILAWAAHTARTVSAERRARALWAASIGVTLIAAASTVVVRTAGPWAVGRELSELAALNVIVWALAATTREYGLHVARSWRNLARALGPLSAAACAALILAFNVGEERPFGASGSFLRAGGTELALPGWAWPIVLSVMIPVMALFFWGVALFIRTYRQANGTHSQRCTAPVDRSSPGHPQP